MNLLHVFYRFFFKYFVDAVKFYVRNHFTGWVVTRPGLEGCGEHHFSPTGVPTPNRRTLASRYSDYTIPAQTVKLHTENKG